jgi:hypothetical protein
VIGRENDERPVVLARRLQARQHLAQRTVGGAELCEMGLLGLADERAANGPGVVVYHGEAGRPADGDLGEQHLLGEAGDVPPAVGQVNPWRMRKEHVQVVQRRSAVARYGRRELATSPRTLAPVHGRRPAEQAFGDLFWEEPRQPQTPEGGD